MKLICLPGFDGSGEAFALFIEELTPSVNTQIIAYPPDRPLGYAALTDWVRERIPRDEQYALLAESFSGPLGI